MSGAAEPAAPVRNIWELAHWWKQLGLSLYDTDLRRTGYIKEEIIAAREGVWDSLLLIHNNLGHVKSFIPPFQRQRLDGWVRNIWSDFARHIRLSKETDVERGKWIICKLYMAYKRSWARAGIHVIAEDATYTTPYDYFENLRKERAQAKALTGTAGAPKAPAPQAPAPQAPASQALAAPAPAAPAPAAPALAPQAPPLEAFKPPSPPRVAAPGTNLWRTPSPTTGEATSRPAASLTRGHKDILPNWVKISPSIAPDAPRSKEEMTKESDDWPSQCDKQMYPLLKALETGLGLFEKGHPIPAHRLHHFYEERLHLIKGWKAWQVEVRDYLFHQHLNEANWAFWERTKEKAEADGEDWSLWKKSKPEYKTTEGVLDYNRMTLKEHEDEKEILEMNQVHFHDQEEALIRKSNSLIIELAKQVNEPRTDAEWRHKVLWEEFGFDFMVPGIIFNAYFDVLAPTGIKIFNSVHERHRLHRLSSDYRDPRSVDASLMWVNSMRLRVSRLRDALMRQGLFDPTTQSIWFSTLPSDEAVDEDLADQTPITTDLAWLIAIQKVMAEKFMSLNGARPIYGRHYIDTDEPNFTFLIRDIPANYQELINQHVDSQVWTSVDEELRAAQLADERSDASARRSHLLAAAESVMLADFSITPPRNSPRRSPNLPQLSPRPRNPPSPEVDFSEFLTELAYENDDADLLELVQSPYVPRSPQESSGNPEGARRRRRDDGDDDMSDAPAEKTRRL